MGENGNLTVSIDEAVVSFSCNHEPLMGFLRALLGRIEVDATPHVRSRLEWVNEGLLGGKMPPLGPDMPQVANNIYGQGDKVAMPFIPGFARFSMRYGTGLPLEVEGRLNYQTFWDRLRVMMRRFPSDYFPTRLMYHMLYYPAAWHLGLNAGKFWVHTGGAMKNGKALLIGGLSGVGKSTMCMRLGEERDFRLLSDDLVFFDGANVYSCYEPVRVRNRVQEDAGVELVGTMGGKFALDLHDQYIGGAKPVALILPRFGDGETRLEEISSERASARLYAVSRLTPQVAEFDYYAGVLSSYFEIDDWFPQQQTRLTETLQDVACYTLWLRREDGPEKAYLLVRDVTDGLF